MTTTEQQLRDAYANPSIDPSAVRRINDLAGRLQADTRRPRLSWLMPTAAAVTVAATLIVTVLAVNQVRGPAPAGQAPTGTESGPVRQPATAGVAPSITVDGKTIPYAGSIPWANAVADPTDPRVLYVEAQGDNLKGVQVCGAPIQRVQITQTTSTVTLLVAGYATPLPAGTACGGVGHAPVRQKIELAAPLAGRPLLDAATDKTHPVLDPATVPTAHHVPSGFVQQPLGWEEGTGLASRVWSSSLDPSGSTLSIEYGSRLAIESQIPAPDGPTWAPVQVGSQTAAVWHTRSQYQDRYSLQWNVDASHSIRMTTNSPPGTPLTETEVLAIARSIQ